MTAPHPLRDGQYLHQYPVPDAPPPAHDDDDNPSLSLFDDSDEDDELGSSTNKSPNFPKEFKVLRKDAPLHELSKEEKAEEEDVDGSGTTLRDLLQRQQQRLHQRDDDNSDDDDDDDAGQEEQGQGHDDVMDDGSSSSSIGRKIQRAKDRDEDDKRLLLVEQVQEILAEQQRPLQPASRAEVDQLARELMRIALQDEQDDEVALGSAATKHEEKDASRQVERHVHSFIQELDSQMAN